MGGSGGGVEVRDSPSTCCYFYYCFRFFSAAAAGGGVLETLEEDFYIHFMGTLGKCVIDYARTEQILDYSLWSLSDCVQWWRCRARDEAKTCKKKYDDKI